MIASKTWRVPDDAPTRRTKSTYRYRNKSPALASFEAPLLAPTKAFSYVAAQMRNRQLGNL